MATETTAMNHTYHDLWAFDASTSFPAAMQFPQSHIISLLDNFFRVVDACVADADASQGHEPLFTKDGVWKTPSATFSGVDQVMNSGHMWERFKTTRTMRHWVLKVYVNDEAGRQLMLLGKIRMEFHDGQVVEKHFGAWVEIEDVSDGGCSTSRLKLFQGWSSQQ